MLIGLGDREKSVNSGEEGTDVRVEEGAEVGPEDRPDIATDGGGDDSGDELVKESWRKGDAGEDMGDIGGRSG